MYVTYSSLCFFKREGNEKKKREEPTCRSRGLVMDGGTNS